MRVWGEQGVTLLHVTDSRVPIEVIQETCLVNGLDDYRHFLLRRCPDTRGVIFPAEDLAQVENVYMFNCSKEENSSGIVKVNLLNNVSQAQVRWIYWHEKQVHIQVPFGPGEDQDQCLCKFIRRYISTEFELYESATLFAKRLTFCPFHLL